MLHALTSCALSHPVLDSSLGEAPLPNHIVKDLQRTDVNRSLGTCSSFIILVNGSAPVLTAEIGVYRHE